MHRAARILAATGGPQFKGGACTLILAVNKAEEEDTRRVWGGDRYKPFPFSSPAHV